MTRTFHTLPSDSPTEPTEPHVILVGLPGAGKTSVGRRLARRLGRPFLDFDDEIEARAGKSISSIFTDDGEDRFRELEMALTRELAQTGGMILAPGGGWAAIPGALALLRPPGRMIYLRVRPEVAYKRIAHGRRPRPLLAGPEPLETLRRLLAQRETSYLTADHVVDSEVTVTQGLMDTLVRLVRT